MKKKPYILNKYQTKIYGHQPPRSLYTPARISYNIDALQSVNNKPWDINLKLLCYRRQKPGAQILHCPARSMSTLSTTSCHHRPGLPVRRRDRRTTTPHFSNSAVFSNLLLFWHLYFIRKWLSIKITQKLTPRPNSSRVLGCVVVVVVGEGHSASRKFIAVQTFYGGEGGCGWGCIETHGSTRVHLGRIYFVMYTRNWRLFFLFLSVCVCVSHRGTLCVLCRDSKLPCHPPSRYGT